MEQLNSKLYDSENTIRCLGFLVIWNTWEDILGRRGDWALRYEPSIYKPVTLAVNFFPYVI